MTENYLQVFKKYHVSELDAISDYIKHSNKSIIDAQMQFEKRFTPVERYSEKTEEEREEYSKIHQIFPNFFRLSTFIALYSHFENKLTHLCDAFQERKGFNLKSSDLSGENLIERCKRYLKLVVGLRFDELNSDWMKITDYQKLRNCFAHNGSNIIRDKTKNIDEQTLYEIIKRYPLLEVTPFGIIFISTDDFLLEFIQLQKTYLGKLIDIADPKFREVTH